MKKLMKLFVLVAAAAMTLASCQKNEFDAPIKKEVHFTINAGISQTKTTITDNGNGTYTPSWDGTESLAVLFELPNEDTKDSHAKKFNNETEAGNEAKFSATVSVDSETGTLYAFYPYEAFGRGFADGVTRLDLNTEQKPTATSFDPACDIMVAKPYDYKVNEGKVVVDPLYFTRVMSVLRVNLKSDFEDVQNETVKSVTFSTDGVNITGYAKISVENPEFTGEWTNKYDYVTATYDSDDVSINGDHNSVYFVVAPVTIPADKNLTFTIKTENYTITKTIEANNHPEMKFDAGNVAVINLNIKEKECTPISGGSDAEIYYEKVTSEPADWSGKYLIVYEETPAYLDGSLTPGKSSGQMGSTAGMISTTISNNKIASSSDVDKSIIIIEKSEDGYALKASSGSYMGMSGNDNGMKSSSSKSDFVHTISFNSEDNSVSLLSSDANTKLAYNKSSKFFRYYKVTTISGNPTSYPLPVLYRLVEGNEGGVTPDPDQPEVIKTLESIAVSGQTTSYFVNEAFKFDGTVTATYEGGETATVTPTSVSEPDMTSEGTETVTVSYTEGAVTVTAEYQITINPVPEITEVTVEEFLEKPVSDNVWYQLTGTITNIANTTYGNFDLTDETGTVYVYGLTKEQASSNDKSFASIGLRVGDKVTLIGTRAYYESGNTDQVGGPAYYVSHEAAPYLEVSKTSIRVGADDTSADFTVDANVEWTVSCATASVTKVDNNVTVTFNANKNTEEVVYEVVVTSILGDKTVTITQAAASQGGEGIVVLNEEFDNSTTADSSTAISTSKFSNFSGATDKAYTSKYGGLKLGSSKAAGYITSKSLDLSSSFTVQIDACKYGSDTGDINVTVGSVTKTIKNGELEAAGSFKTYTLSFDAATANSTVKIATSSKRAYIDNVVITRN